MRPRKVVMLVDGDERRRMTHAFVLDVAGWRVLECATVGHALALLGSEAAGKVTFLCDPGAVHVVVATLGPDASADREQLLARLRKLHPQAALVLRGGLLMGAGQAAAGALFPDVWLDTACNTEVLIDTLKRVTARKRGPRPVAGPHSRSTATLIPLGVDATAAAVERVA